MTCSDNDSTGNVAAKSAAIVLATAETVTCTFTSVNARKRTVEVISRFMGRRNDMLLSNGPDTNRQIDRLMEAAGNENGGGAGFAAGGGSQHRGRPRSMAAARGRVLSRLGGGDTATIGSGLASAATSGPVMQGRAGPGLRPRSFEERLSELGTGNTGSEPREQAGLSPFAVTGSTESATRMSFATSLSQMMKFHADAEDRKAQAALAGDGMALNASNVPKSRRRFNPLDIWVEGQFQSFTDDRNKADTDGHFSVFYLGTDYVVSPQFLIGALVQYDTMQQTSQTQGYDIKGKGWMAGPYATVRLSDNLFLQGRAAWGRSDNEVSPFLTYTDTFTTTRWLATSTLIGRWRFGDWQLRPSATVAYIEDVSEAYTDKLGVGIPSVKAALGQMKAGPEVSYRFEGANGTVIEPRLGVQVIWNFASTNKAASFGGTLAGPEEVRGQVEIGLRAQSKDGFGLDISGSYDGIGSSEYRALGGKATVRIPLN